MTRTNFPEEASSAAPTGNTLTLDRLLDAPREAVWRCLTTPALLKEWFCPKPWTVSRAELDVRPGGRSLIVMRGPEGQEMPNAGVYLAVEPGRRLVATDAFVDAWIPSGKAFMVAEYVLEDAPGGKTHYVAHAHHWSADDRDTHNTMGFQQGWGAAADQLEELAKGL